MRIILILLCFGLFGYAEFFCRQLAECDSTQNPYLDFEPKELNVVNDSSQFYSAEIKILNRGGGTLRIEKILASCYCSNGYILENDIKFLDTGLVFLNINKKGLEEDQNSVVFTVYSNATNSPSFYIVKFIEALKSEEQK